MLIIKNIQKKRIILIGAFILFIAFLIFSTITILNKPPKKQDININVIDTKLDTVYLLPNKGEIEIKVDNISSTLPNSANEVTYTTANSLDSKDSNIYTDAIKYNNTKKEIKPIAPKVNPEERYKIPETGGYYNLGLNLYNNLLIKVFLIFTVLGILIRLFIKTII